MDAFFEVVTMIASAKDVQVLYSIKSLHFEKLKGQREHPPLRSSASTSSTGWRSRSRKIHMATTSKSTTSTSTTNNSKPATTKRGKARSIVFETAHPALLVAPGLIRSASLRPGA